MRQQGKGGDTIGRGGDACNTFRKFQSLTREEKRKGAYVLLAMRLGTSQARNIGLVIVFMWFLIGGIAHFVATATEMRIVPPYIPWPRATVLVSGAFELLGALGLLYPPTRRAAGLGLFALTIAVTPAHIYMLRRPDLFAVPYWALVLRLPLQAALLLLIAWSASVFRAAAHTREGH